eukprot:CAMPEP_0204827330 /NCGR_PEP_ID=MMETSP1346-20131115/4798_1 /ASSEMBLY_ACC=CAM_ASM_000771 /TAXON_ID=215587 /ORGANISM="Aplanochytrium stocchinoi, Strain GSBS06" /LENGTH=413 /DNA_ID=CAMNT_0051955697 /DNA_START=625 /DNA_END=1866 /DNA_ORIENTATION=+
MKSVDSVIVDLAVDDSLTWMPQPKFDQEFRHAKCGSTEAELLEGISKVDPFSLVEDELKKMNSNIKDLLGSDHPVLSTVANYFFSQEGGKKIRPVLVILFARAANAHVLAEKRLAAQADLDARKKLKELKQAKNMETNDIDISDTINVEPEKEPLVESRQLRLAEITEMIHTASLLHDDVIDVADTRRGVKSVNQLFGNKLAILAGDFLLARASVCLARLRSLEVVEVLSTVIEHLVKGEVMQMKSDMKGPEAFEYYLRKNYYKTGSLIANSVLASTMLGNHSEEVQEIAFEYGEAIGQAFQLVDDALDFEGSLQSLGKPALNDLKLGFATAPVLFAQDDFPHLKVMIERKFSLPGDIDEAAEYVQNSKSITQTRELAMAYIERAINAAKRLHPSPERDALIHLALKIVNRSC